jgi:hypothetical protein
VNAKWVSLEETAAHVVYNQTLNSPAAPKNSLHIVPNDIDATTSSLVRAIDIINTVAHYSCQVDSFLALILSFSFTLLFSTYASVSCSLHSCQLSFS